ncbi:MAG: mechanosensitive ion channel family protein [Proteobacteria bacterium]|nr:mechanosensitive ion channel family protein [Pseudomonadota bacterium]MBU1715341.1 mechanosensitive ion channel family protein [Pseudomonadota bacterium]
MYDLMAGWLAEQGFSTGMIQLVEIVAAVIFLLLIIVVTAWVSRQLLVPVLEKAVRSTNNTWDDVLVAKGFFKRLSHLLPIVIIYVSADLMLQDFGPSAEIVKRLAMSVFVVAGVRALDAFLLAVREISSNLGEASRGKPISGYLEALKIVFYVLAAIFVISILTDKSPWGILSVFGGLTAVVLLVFKDTILGFVAGLQLSSNDMVRIGDWIEMPSYGVDGDVIDLSIHTVKVRNWDKTIATIPTYALVSNSFKNWRGMSEAGGRRIKRAIHLDMNSVKFCTDEMLARFEKFSLLADYLQAKKEEINRYNQEHRIDTSQLVNGRRQTNIGVFRAYVVAYLKNHPKIHQEMTFLVRHLPPTAQGLPLEIYVFSNDQVWANYEAIQADIFDHLLAVIPMFDLRIFQYPAGYDLRLAGKEGLA